MGKPLTIQRRGKGGVFTAPSHRFKTEVSYRNYDKLEKDNKIRAEIIDLVDDPARTTVLMKLMYENGEELLLPAPEGIKVGDTTEEGSKALPGIGNVLPLYKIPEGFPIFNLEVKPGDGGALARSSGVSCFIIAREKDKILIKLPSGKIKKFNKKCRAMIGNAAGGGRVRKPMLKAGVQHYKRKARGQLFPVVRGVKMNVYDHPFGGKQHHGVRVKKKKGGSPGHRVGLFGSKRRGRRKKK